LSPSPNGASTRLRSCARADKHQPAMIRGSDPGQEQSGTRVLQPFGLIPHVGAAVLLDEIRDTGQGDRLSATVLVRPGTAFSSADGSLPGWVGVEILAQLVAAFATLASSEPAGPARVGLLTGVRMYRCRPDNFSPGTLLEAGIVEAMTDGSGIGVFDGTLTSAGEVVAEGILTAYRLDDPEAFLRGVLS
jgi:predicted hotdog family 3-hydroxylacyl-ACP dehydratase